MTYTTLFTTKVRLIALSFCCFSLVTTYVQAQDNPSIGAFTTEIQKGSFQISLDELNKALINSGFDPIPANDAAVSNGMVTMTYDLPSPEEGEDEDAGLLGIGLAPKSVLKAQASAPNYNLGQAINGLDFDDNGSLVSSYSIPPDPDGAVGTNHVGHVVNVAISFHTKAGTELAGYPKSLRSFFGPLNPVNNTFDPKILWDQYENRWVVVTLEKTGSTSRVLIAVSATADPAGTWYFQGINAVDGTCWFDYPGFAIDDKAIYVTGNYFQLSNNAYCNSQVLIIDKGVSGGIYAGTTSTNENPATNSAFNLFNPVDEAGTGNNLTNMPAHTYGSRTSSEGTYLIGYSGLSNGTEFFQVFTITNPLAASPTFTQQYVAMGDVENEGAAFPDATQLGNATPIETNGRRTLDAIWRDGKLWTVTQVVGIGTNLGEVSSLWAKLNATTAGGVSLDAVGLLDGEDISTDAHVWMPSIAVNSSGDAAVGYSAVSSTIYAGAYASIIDGMTNSAGSSITVKTGTDDYVRTFGGSSNRWGDYSGTALDPVNEHFWVFQEAAISNGTPLSGENGRWQVFIQELEPESMGCVTDLNITDNPVPADTYEASNSITTNDGSTIAVNAGSTVTFQAGNLVQLNNGFHAKSGSIFTATIAPCSGAFRSGEPQETYSASQVADLEIAKTNPLSIAMAVYPNPSSGATMLEYRLPTDTEVAISLFNQSGQEVAALVQQQQQAAGQHQVSFNTNNLPNGFYLISIRTNKEMKYKKLMVSGAR